MEIFVGKKGEKLGPFTTFNLREQLEQEVICGDDLGWVRGMDDWIPLRDFESLRSMIEDIERQSNADEPEEEPGLNAPTAEELGYPNRSQSEGPPPLPSNLKSGEATISSRLAEIEAISTKVHPFRRFFARMLDYVFVSLATGAIFKPAFDFQTTEEFLPQWQEFISSPEGIEFSIISLVSLLAWVPIEALLISMFGTTPGKAVFRLYVTDESGEPPRWWTAFARSLAAWLIGFGAGISILPLPLMMVAFFQLLTRGSVFWDRYYGTNVTMRPFSLMRIILVASLFLTLFVLTQFLILSK